MVDAEPFDEFGPLLVQGDEGRSLLAREKTQGVRLKSDDHRRQAKTDGTIPHTGNETLVSDVDPVEIADGDAGPFFQTADLIRPSNAMHEISSSRQQAGLPLYQKDPGFNTDRGFEKLPRLLTNKLKSCKNNFF